MFMPIIHDNRNAWAQNFAIAYIQIWTWNPAIYPLKNLPI